MDKHLIDCLLAGTIVGFGLLYHGLLHVRLTSRSCENDHERND